MLNIYCYNIKVFKNLKQNSEGKKECQVLSSFTVKFSKNAKRLKPESALSIYK